MRPNVAEWLVEHFFDQVFHPDLEPQLSQTLKRIERKFKEIEPSRSGRGRSDAVTEGYKNVL
ncbi:hypothetical protein V2W45_1343518 [Cenococcum geophilum]